jgi:hypothetical protein
MEEGRLCAVCGIDITDKKATAKTCSLKCRKLAFSRRSIGTEQEQNGTPNVVLAEHQEPELYFEFFTQTVERKTDMGKIPAEKSSTRKAKYWYDVPVAAIPVIKKGYPEMPDYMNGRQFFLWWKNEFKMNGEKPEILNPYPDTTGAVYVKAGEGSRHWGTV